MIVQVLVLCAAGVLADPIVIYDQAIDARKNRDAQRFLQLTRQLVEYSPASPGLHFLYAESLAMSTDTASTLVELRWLATSGYSYEFWDRDSFAKLPSSEAAALRAAMAKNGEPAGRVAHSHRLDRDDLDPEGIAAIGQDWIIGSMTNGSLYRVDRTGATTLLWQESEAGRRLFGV